MKKNSLVLFVLICLVPISAFSQTNNFSQDRIINVDLTKTKGKFNTMFNECVGAGRARQVEQIKKQNDGSPILKEIVSIKNGTPFSKELDIRENDVFFLNIIKL